MSAVYRRDIEAEILADNPPHSVQLPNRYPRQMAWKPLSVSPALSIRSARDLGRRIRRPVHSLGLDKPRPLRSTMASTHGNLVLPPSRPVAEGGTEDHRSRRAIAPPIASRLSESAFASGPPKVSSPRCSPDAYTLSYREKMECDDGSEISSWFYRSREDGVMGSLATALSPPMRLIASSTFWPSARTPRTTS